MATIQRLLIFDFHPSFLRRFNNILKNVVIFEKSRLFNVQIHFQSSYKIKNNYEKSRAVVSLEILWGLKNIIWICFISKIVVSNSNWVNMSESEFFFSKKSRFSLNILKNVQKCWHNRFSHPILLMNTKFNQNLSINK